MAHLMVEIDDITGPKQRTFLVHGEPDKSAALHAALKEKHPPLSIEGAALLQEAAR